MSYYKLININVNRSLAFSVLELRWVPKQNSTKKAPQNDLRGFLLKKKKMTTSFQPEVQSALGDEYTQDIALELHLLYVNTHSFYNARALAVDV